MNALDLFLTDILKQLEAISFRIPPNPIDPRDEGHYLIAVVSHVRHLIREAERPAEDRFNSTIRSSWGTVSKAGKRYGLFKPYEGNTALREELAAFLESGSPPLKPRPHA